MKTVVRIYSCALCGGPVTKNAKSEGLGKFKCVNKGCTVPATSINKSGPMATWIDSNGRKHEATAIRTGQSPHARVRVRLA